MLIRRSLLAGTLALGCLLTTAFGSVAFAGEPTTASDPACTGHWPIAAQGMPATFKAGARAGDYVWHSASGWHLRVTHVGTGKLVFSGRVVSDVPLSVTPVRLEGTDYVALSADKKTITYRLTNYGRIDGFDFTTACAQRLTFAGHVAGSRLPALRIWVGRYGRHPLQNPFSIIRVH
jgi:hypothetical protein